MAGGHSTGGAIMPLCWTEGRDCCRMGQHRRQPNAKWELLCLHGLPTPPLTKLDEKKEEKRQTDLKRRKEQGAGTAAPVTLPPACSRSPHAVDVHLPRGAAPARQSTQRRINVCGGGTVPPGIHLRPWTCRAQRPQQPPQRKQAPGVCTTQQAQQATHLRREPACLIRHHTLSLLCERRVAW